MTVYFSVYVYRLGYKILGKSGFITSQGRVLPRDIQSLDDIRILEDSQNPRMNIWLVTQVIHTTWFC